MLTVYNPSLRYLHMQNIFEDDLLQLKKINSKLSIFISGSQIAASGMSKEGQYLCVVTFSLITRFMKNVFNGHIIVFKKMGAEFRNGSLF